MKTFLTKTFHKASDLLEIVLMRKYTLGQRVRGLQVCESYSLCKKCPYSEFCCPYSPSFVLNTERYEVQMFENADQENSEYGHLSLSDSEERYSENLDKSSFFNKIRITLHKK